MIKTDGIAHAFEVERTVVRRVDGGRFTRGVTELSLSHPAADAAVRIAHMSDTAQSKGWRPSRTQKIVAVLLLLIVWTAVANSWTEKGCNLRQGYLFVVTHGGSPDRDQGCEDEPGGPVYTDRYYG